MVYVRNDMIQRRRHYIEKCAFDNGNERIKILSVDVSINKETWLFMLLLMSVLSITVILLFWAISMLICSNQMYFLTELKMS